MCYAEHVMNHEYLQTDAIGCRERCLSEQCSPISGLTQAKHSRLSRAMRIQVVYTRCPSFSFFTYIFVPTSFWISLDFCTDDMRMTSRQWKILLIPVYGNIFNWASLYIDVLQWVFVSQWTLVVIFKAKEWSHFREQALKPIMMDVKSLHYLSTMPTYKIKTLLNELAKHTTLKWFKAIKENRCNIN